MQPAVATGTAVAPVNAISLFRGGVDALRGMCNDAADADCVNFNPTFNNNDDGENWSIAANGTITGGTVNNLPVLSADQVEQVCGVSLDLIDHDANGATPDVEDADADGTADFVYYMLGVGQGSNMVGRTITDAPVHFAQTGAMNANNKYNRLVAIIKVDNDNDGDNAATQPAQFMCSAMAMMKVEGLQQALARHYSRTDEG